MIDKKLFKLRENESDDDYIIRIGMLKDSLGMTWEDLAKIINSELDLNYTESRYRKQFTAFMKGYYTKEGEVETASVNPVSEFLQQKIELEKLKVQSRDERTVFNQLIREQARAESMQEAIVTSIQKLKVSPAPLVKLNPSKEKVGCLIYGDCHYGKEFTVYGLEGEIINEYNPQIFKERMWQIRDQICEICEKEGLNEIYIFDLGDKVEGLLRNSALQHIRTSIVDMAMEFANFMKVWIDDISKSTTTKVKYISITGNHGEIRYLNAKNGDFPQENIERVIDWYLENTLKDNPNISFHKKYDNEVAYINVLGTDVLATHKVSADKIKSMREYESVYGKNVDIIFSGHSHHRSSEDVGIDKEVLVCSSIIGVEDFAMKIKKTSSPGADFFIFEKDKGKTVSYNLKIK